MSYDASLLASAPKATREMVQEGYNPNILKANTEPKSKSVATLESQSKEIHQTTHITPKIPFYRTRAGLITISLLVLVILGAIIGGAVGGTRHSHPITGAVTNSSSSASSNSSSSTAAGDQGVGNGTSTNGASTLFSVGTPTITSSTTGTNTAQTTSIPGFTGGGGGGVPNRRLITGRRPLRRTD